MSIRCRFGVSGGKKVYIRMDSSWRPSALNPISDSNFIYMEGNNNKRRLYKWKWAMILVVFAGSVIFHLSAFF